MLLLAGVLTVFLNNLLQFTDDDEARLTGANTPQILRCVPAKQAQKVPLLEYPMKEVIYELLNALIVKCNYKTEEGLYLTLFVFANMHAIFLLRSP